MKNYFDKYVISITSVWKGHFDTILLIASAFNSFSQGFYAAFGNPTEPLSVFVEWATEILFGFDLVFCFCQEYNDHETYMKITEIKMIAKNYLKSGFIFDLIALFPFGLFLMENSGNYEKNARLFKLLKLLRVPRLFALLEVDKIRKTI